MSRVGRLPGAEERFVRHQGLPLLVPVDAVDAVDAVDEPVAAPADGLRGELAAARDLIAVRADDAWLRRAQQAEHRIAMADVAEQAAAAKRARRERARDAVEGEALAALYRRATRSGARARIRALINGSAEMRALRVAKVRTVSLAVLLPVLAAFAGWSTTGAQAGAVRLLDLVDHSAAWTASWGVEPALIAVVALIIIVRAVLRSSGGDTDWRATLIECTALGLSLALNIIGGWHGDWEGLVTVLPHAIGPLGCAGTAFLIAVIDSYVTAARPWDGAPRLAEIQELATPQAAVPVQPVQVAAVPVLPVPAEALPATGTETRAVAARAATAMTGRAGTGPGRVRAVPATSGSSRRAITARTDTGTPTPVPGSAKAAARMFWEAEVAAGRTPTGADLARAAGRDNDDTGQFRRYARQWAEQTATGTGTGAPVPATTQHRYPGGTAGMDSTAG